MAKKILVIEDYKETAELIKTIFEMKGHVVSLAYDGTSGLQMAAGDKPDLIILDVMLPGMNGIEVCKQLKSAPETAKVPVIIVSVLAASEEAMIGKDAGADDYIAKPFNTAELVRIAGKYI